MKNNTGNKENIEKENQSMENQNAEIPSADTQNAENQNTVNQNTENKSAKYENAESRSTENADQQNPDQGKWRFLKAHPFWAAVLLSLVLGAFMSVALQVIFGIGDLIGGTGFGGIAAFAEASAAGIIILGGFMIFPLVLTAAEVFLLVKGRRNQELYQRCRVLDVAGIALGALYSLIYLSIFYEVSFGRDWQEQLVNRQTHTPVYTQAQLTVIMVALTAAAGYLIVNYIPLRVMPPLALVLGLAAMYLGTIESVVWGIQVFRGRDYDFFLLLYPLNCLLLTARTVSHKMWEWKQLLETDESRRQRYLEGTGIFHRCNRFLAKSERWPLAAFLLMWPLLGILIGLLMLFGQKPDAVIRAFTETSDWNLSQRVAPQNIYFDEHYLCTVAAGGHEKIVKPKRLGVRHGHQVIVNRQLCIANAFEQVLEERTPRFHRAVRRFYDTYGFPAAKLIRSKYAADVVYFIMKPLEWIFLAVLYLTDANPENRIAIQYTGKRLEDFK